MLMIKALDNLSKGSFANNFNQLIPVSYMVSFLYSVVALLIVEAVVYESFQLRGLDLFFVGAQIIKLFVLIDLCLLESSQEVVAYLLVLLCCFNADGQVKLLSGGDRACFVADCELLSF